LSRDTIYIFKVEAEIFYEMLDCYCGLLRRHGAYIWRSFRRFGGT